jgi:hypothetical protein
MALQNIFRDHFDPEGKSRLQIIWSGWPWNRQERMLWLALGIDFYYSGPNALNKGIVFCLTIHLVVDINFWVILKREPKYTDVLKYPEDTDEIKKLFADPASSGQVFKELPVLRAHREVMTWRMQLPNEVSNDTILHWYFRDRHPVTFEKLDEE